MNIFKVIIIFAIIAIMINCSEHRNDISVSNINVSDSIFFTEPLDTFPKGIIDSIYWIPLQSSDKNIIKEISKLCVTDSLILICDKYQGLVQAYSKEGNFEYQIKNKGNGPYEYLEIAAFTITPTSIYILDNYSNKISRYAIKTGRFIEKTTVPFVAWDMEAFDDNDFLFTYLSNNPEAHIDYKPIGFAVWRTNEHWEITHQYLPVDKDYTELYGKSRYFTRSGHNIVFHALKYNGYFIFSENEIPDFYPIMFSNPVPTDHNIRLDDVNKGHWQFLAETPFRLNGYGIVEISVAGRGEQLFAIDSSKKIYSNSETNAQSIPIDIVGTMNNGFIGCINDNYDLYKTLTQYGFSKGNKDVESILKRGGCCLIIYQMKSLVPHNN